MAILPGSDKEVECVEYLKKEFPAEKNLDADDTHFLDGDTYLRFARAREGNQEKAAHMLKAALEWRKSYKPYTLTAASVKEVMEQVTMCVGGRCKGGRPVLLMTLGVPNKCDTVDRVKQLVFILEETQRKGYTSITWIIDFAEMGKHKRDSRSKETRKETMKILQDYYPERLGLMLLYRPPWYVRMMLPLVRSFIDSRTSKKIFMAGHKIEDLEKYIDKDQLPEKIGGGFKTKSEEALAELPQFNEKTAPKAAEPVGQKAY